MTTESYFSLSFFCCTMRFCDILKKVSLRPKMYWEKRKGKGMPPAGIFIIIGFVILITLCIIADKNKNKKFRAKIESEYNKIDSSGNYSITDRGELMLYLPSGSLVGYKVWNLSDIAYIGISDLKPSMKSLSILDANKKAMKGTYLTPSKKPLKEIGYTSFGLNIGQSFDDVVNLVQKHAGHVQVIRNGNVVG